MEYRSRARLFGLPLLHVATGSLVDGRYHRGVARGWVAVGDVSFGLLLSIGGIAAGGIALGGISVGGLAIAGVALGLFSAGGLALGLGALGGAAVAWSAAEGGLAVARDFALGGVAFATHANDPVAREHFTGHPLFGPASLVLGHSIWLVALPTGIGLIQLVLRAAARRSQSGH
jgi:hypothetical protein